MPASPPQPQTPVTASDPGSLNDGGHKQARKERRTVSKRLTPALSKGWTAVPDALLQGMTRITWKEGEEVKHLRAIHLLVIVHLLSAKWGEAMPYISAKTVGERAGISEKTILDALTDLRTAGLIKRARRAGPNASRWRYTYDLAPLFARIEQVREALIHERIYASLAPDEDDEDGAG